MVKEQYVKPCHFNLSYCFSVYFIFLLLLFYMDIFVTYYNKDSVKVAISPISFTKYTQHASQWLSAELFW